MRVCLGTDHADVASAHIDVADALKELKRHADAGQHYRRALAMQDGFQGRSIDIC